MRSPCEKWNVERGVVNIETDDRKKEFSSQAAGVPESQTDSGPE